MLNVDQYYCISLAGREDRRKIIAKQWHRLGVEPNYFVREKDAESPVRGCFESHVAVAKDALAKGYKHILVLEDDFKFLEFDDKQFEVANQFIHSDKMDAVDLFFLGHFPRKMHLSEYPGIAHVKGNGTHAYILAEQGIKKIAHLEFTGTAIDSYYKKMFKAVALFPMICIQYPESVMASDISQEGVVEEDGGWGRRLRKQYKQVYFFNLHKSILCKLKGLFNQ